jgi:Ca2+-binding EF-hand superfamily protein
MGIPERACVPRPDVSEQNYLQEGEKAMENVLKTRRRDVRRALVATVAAASAAALVAPAIAGTTSGANGNPVTISTSGSTALKNFMTSVGFGEVDPGSTLALSNGNWAPVGGWTTAGMSMILDPTTYTTPVTTGLNQTANALRVEYHESGSVEGILELANDQIQPVNYVQNNVDRNPNTGNAVWVNGNQFGGVGGTFSVGQSANGYYLGPVYGTDTSGNQYTFQQAATLGLPKFNAAGVNVSPVTGSGPNGAWQQAGQNAVQLAVSDVIPVQAFASDNTTESSTPWLTTPGSPGYGQGNTALPAGGIVNGTGVAGGHPNLQSATALDMPANVVNPRSATNATFGTGAWNTGELNNLSSQEVAVTATVFVANPGTGLDRLDRTDAQWLQTTGRLENGASFQMSTRDVNSGTRNVAALNTGIDPSWAVGVNDDGNGNGATGATGQISIGPGIAFSNKTAGGAQLRPTVQNARMAVGTLSVGDSNGNFLNTEGDQVRALEYSDSTSGTSPYVLVSAQNITSTAYAIYQNEQFVTLKAPTAGLTATQWDNASTGVPSGTTVVAAQGDDSSNDVSKVEANVLQTVNDFASQVNGTNSSLATSAFALLNKGFVLPIFMQKEKAEDGINQSVTNPSYNSTLSGEFIANYGQFTNASDPDTMEEGNTGGTVTHYGDKGTNTASFEGQVAITTQSSSFAATNAPSSTAGGNWLFGNFDQSGVRDYNSSVVTALAACTALENSGNSVGGSNSLFTGGSTSDNTAVISGTQSNSALTPLASMNSGAGATKGDLIVMGDYQGQGTFTGADLYDMAIGASVADSGDAITPTSTTGDHLSLGSESLQVTGTSGSNSSVTTETFGDAVRQGVLFKNNALDYMSANATTQEKTEAATAKNGGATPNATQVANAFNKFDVAQTGVVGLNDLQIIDHFVGEDTYNQGDQLTATIASNGTINPHLPQVPFNLNMAEMIDNKSAGTGSADSNGNLQNEGLQANVNNSFVPTNSAAHEVAGASDGAAANDGQGPTITDPNTGITKNVNILRTDFNVAANYEETHDSSGNVVPVGSGELIPGDVTLDGTVDNNDVVAILNNFGNFTNPLISKWTGGDLTGDGVVDNSDLAIVLNNFGDFADESQAEEAADKATNLADALAAFNADGLAADGVVFNAGSDSFAAVPEPGTLTLLTMTGGALLARRRRSTKKA